MTPQESWRRIRRAHLQAARSLGGGTAVGWKQLHASLQALEEGLESMPPAKGNVEHFARIELANAIARAREILEALAHDEEKAQ